MHMSSSIYPWELLPADYEYSVGPSAIDYMPFQKLSPDARRVRTIIVSLPLIGVTSCTVFIYSADNLCLLCCLV